MQKGLELVSSCKSRLQERSTLGPGFGSSQELIFRFLHILFKLLKQRLCGYGIGEGSLTKTLDVMLHGLISGIVDFFRPNAQKYRVQVYELNSSGGLRDREVSPRCHAS